MRYFLLMVLFLVSLLGFINNSYASKIEISNNLYLEKTDEAISNIFTTFFDIISFRNNLSEIIDNFNELNSYSNTYKEINSLLISNIKYGNDTIDNILIHNEELICKK